MKRVLIVGAGDAGQDVNCEIRKDRKLRLVVVGFIDDDPQKMNQKIQGIRVLGKKEDLKKIVRRQKIDEVIIAIPSADGERIANYVKICSEARVGFKIVPRVKEIIENKAKFSNLRRVKVEDLLGRPVVKSEVAGLKSFFRNKVVLVTGAAGSIGSELSRQIAAYSPKRLVLLDWWENGIFEIKNELKKYFPRLKFDVCICNIRENSKLENIFALYKPHYVFHAAAYKHVPLMEDSSDEAVLNNILGTRNVAYAAKKNRTERFVLVSTDKAANPKSVMGATKLVAEAVVKSLNGKTKYMSVRFGNVLDSNGSVIPTFRKQIEEGGPVTITDRRMSRYFMTIPEAAQLILKAASIGEGGELFLLDMGDPVKIIDLAESMIRLSGYIPGKDIKIVFTGIRSGEKLRERLFNLREKLTATKLEKIFVTESLGINLENINILVEKLGKLASSGNRIGIRKELARHIKCFIA